MPTTTGTTDLPDEPEENLATKVVVAEKAVSCCRAGYIRAQIDALDAASEILSAVLDPPTRSKPYSLAFVPAIRTAPGVIAPPVRFPKIIRIGPGPLVLGTVVLIGVDGLLDIAGQTAAITGLTAVVDALAFLKRSAPTGSTVGVDDDTCAECIKRRVLSQTSQRKEQAKIGRFRQ